MVIPFVSLLSLNKKFNVSAVSDTPSDIAEGAIINKTGLLLHTAYSSSRRTRS